MQIERIKRESTTTHKKYEDSVEAVTESLSAVVQVKLDSILEVCDIEE